MEDLIYNLFVLMQRILACVAFILGLTALVAWMFNIRLYHLPLIGIMLIFLGVYLLRSSK